MRKKTDFEIVKNYIIPRYKRNRLYDRNKETGWDDDYGDRIVKMHVKNINNDGFSTISMHDSIINIAIYFYMNKHNKCTKVRQDLKVLLD